MSGFVQLVKIKGLKRARDGTPEQRLRTAISAHQKTHSSDAAVRKQPAVNKEIQSWDKFKRVTSLLAKSRFEKHLHASIVASHVVNRGRDACCPQSLT